MSNYYSNLNECSSCQELHAKVIELSDALRKSTRLTTAEQISANEIEFTIPMSKFEEVKAAMESSRDSISVTFDKSGILQRAEPDIFRGQNG